MVEEVNDYKCATCLIELEKYLIMRKYSLARHLAEYGDNYRRCENQGIFMVNMMKLKRF